MRSEGDTRCSNSILQVRQPQHLEGKGCKQAAASKLAAERAAARLPPNGDGERPTLWARELDTQDWSQLMRARVQERGIELQAPYARGADRKGYDGSALSNMDMDNVFRCAAVDTSRTLTGSTSGSRSAPGISGIPTPTWNDDTTGPHNSRKHRKQGNGQKLDKRIQTETERRRNTVENRNPTYTGNTHTTMRYGRETQSRQMR
ncbi:hypothetical protein AXG93_815s1530 [Marchantia polymorpha subsp. ruderalis]|uniref:Uncharacterized protein n=1 Tax=Marchantia polymorpha subsp. ruderalis TaxID=1480154 RepID=A0A176W093_MARPO|nr:hypothetical protein AXG93_815s1530 [Marchantia polymorpha subsp. ruderalis]